MILKRSGQMFLFISVYLFVSLKTYFSSNQTKSFLSKIQINKYNFINSKKAIVFNYLIVLHFVFLPESLFILYWMSLTFEKYILTKINFYKL